MVLYQEISDFLEPLTGRSHSIPGMVKLLAVLHFLATGSFQSVTGVVVGMSQPSFSRHLTVVLSALLTLVPKYVCFPTTPEEWHKVKLAFYRIAHMPNVLGAIDCIQVALRPPRFMEEQYKNRKQLNSLNVQMVCDAHLRIMSVHYGFPGSCNDSHILRRSPLFRTFEEGHMPEGWLLGTATYGCRPWLLTPLLNPRTPADHKYNDAHKSTHSTIEKTFEELKSKFRCLDHSEGVLQYSPRKVWDIVLVTCMLYNLTLRQGDLPSDLDPLPEEQNGDDISLESTEGGIAVRSMLISSYFQ
ncbi:putative nuclease HARBI1 [Bombina bombina]|uniref:putative nuclease HARBI1 n=1 Tax=Bombina bombina TaxID=8345 RepID=UPI00235B2668|nr:putative nuclease HARBI1 [Bombina bombina]